MAEAAIEKLAANGEHSMANLISIQWLTLL
jgi:hypothetical protein